MKQYIDKSSPINNKCHAHLPRHVIKQLILVMLQLPCADGDALFDRLYSTFTVAAELSPLRTDISRL